MQEVINALGRIGVDASSLRLMRATDSGDVLALHHNGGEEAVRFWHQLRQAAPTTGHWPVICANDEPHPHDDDQSVAAQLAAINQIDPDAWFATRREEQLADVDDSTDVDEDWAGPPPDGQWPEDATPNHSFGSPFDVQSYQPLARVTIALVPTTRPWQAPAFLGLGGWNDCPAPQEHCAVLRYWQDRYGAEIAAADHDVIELHITRPPTDRNAAMTLAREHFDYCADIQAGCETIAELAAALLDATVWSFWWD